MDQYIMDEIAEVFFFFQAEDGIRDLTVTGVQTCALPICRARTGAADRRSARPAGGGRERQPRVGQGDLRLEPLEPERARVSVESRGRPPDRAGAGRVAALDRRLHPTVADARRAVVERAVQLAHLDSRDPDLPRRAAAGG